jgi:hypothetical protein
MFRIVQFKFSYDTFLAHEDNPALARLVEVGAFLLEGDECKSEPMATTSQRYRACRDYLRQSLRLAPDPLIVDLTSKYALLATRAPASYDFDDVIVVGHAEDERLVAVPLNTRSFLTGRYSSGFFTPVEIS